MSTLAGRDGTDPASTLGPGRSQGGLPLTIRFSEADYAALLRIAAARSTSASHLIEDLVRHALAHSTIPDPKDALPPGRAKRAGDLIADGETDGDIARVLGVSVAAVAHYRANHHIATAKPEG